MKKYKILGVTSYANRYLIDLELDSLKNLIGTTCQECEEVNDSLERLLLLEDGETAHPDFLILEEIK